MLNLTQAIEQFFAQLDHFDKYPTKRFDKIDILKQNAFLAGYNHQNPDQYLAQNKGSFVDFGYLSEISNLEYEYYEKKKSSAKTCFFLKITNSSEIVFHPNAKPSFYSQVFAYYFNMGIQLRNHKIANISHIERLPFPWKFNLGDFQTIRDLLNNQLIFDRSGETQLILAN